MPALIQTQPPGRIVFIDNFLPKPTSPDPITYPPATPLGDWFLGGGLWLATGYWTAAGTWKATP